MPRLVRVAAVGAVDDGKSTLLGRLLYDTGQLTTDQREAVAAASRRRGRGELDLSFVTDGLAAEREQGITIDVASRTVELGEVRLVIADCPGHLEYGANTATGASTADALILVVDATAGLRRPTRRHLVTATLFGARRVVLAVSKMDAVGWSEARFREVVAEVSGLADRLGVRLDAVPVSGVDGDNVARVSTNSPWYEGGTLLELCRDLEATPDAPRLAIQRVSRLPDGDRLYAGQLFGGHLRRGEEVIVLPSGRRSSLVGLTGPDGPLAEVRGPAAVTVGLADDLDVGRGDVLVPIAPREGRGEEPAAEVRVSRSHVATVAWWGEVPLGVGTRCEVIQATRRTRGQVSRLVGRIDLETCSLVAADRLDAQDLGVVVLDTADPLIGDRPEVARATGTLVCVEPITERVLGGAAMGAPSWVEDLVPAGSGGTPAPR
jgi:sulfate adenylyltransferase subunit 1